MLDELALRLPTHSYLATILRVETARLVRMLFITHEAQGETSLTLIDFIEKNTYQK